MIGERIEMVDLVGQYKRIESDINSAVINCIRSGSFINGPAVRDFEQKLGEYLKVRETIGCGNGTDALQIALMSLNLQPGDEVIVPAFTYVATAEVVALLNLKPVMVDVDPDHFTIQTSGLEEYITDKTRAIVPVHLYGQSANMEMLLELADKHSLYIIEDNAQAIGAEFIFKEGNKRKTGTIGHIGCTSFFPSKNLGCYGDGGALTTNDAELAAKIRMIANHGQSKKYYHSLIGLNSRLDSLQAAVLNVKLDFLNDYIAARNKVADLYDSMLKEIADIQIPVRYNRSTHVFHQYTIKVKNGRRDELKEILRKSLIPSMVYYPVPLYRQEAFKQYYQGHPLENTERLCNEVLSLPIHTELSSETVSFICEVIKNNFC